MISCQGRPANKVSFSDEEEKVYEISLEKALNQTHSVQLSMIGSDIEYIPLETNSKSVFSRVYKIAMCKSYIFVTDAQRVHQFDKVGNFVRQIGSRGRGPGEYQGLSIRDICVNDSLNRLIVLELFTHIFDFDGKHVNQFRNDTLQNLDRVFPWKENQMIYHYMNIQKSLDPKEYSLVILNEQGELLNIYKNYHKRVQSNFSMSNSGPLYSFLNKIRFKEFGVDTLYTIENDKLIPYAIFDLGNKALPADIHAPDWRKLQDVMNGYPGKYWLRFIEEDNKNFYLSFSRLDDDTSLKGVSSKVTCETMILGNNGFQNDIDGGLPFFPKYVYNDSILVDWVEAFDLHEHVLNGNATEMRRLYGQKYDDLVKLVNSLHDESNPILVMVKR